RVISPRAQAPTASNASMIVTSRPSTLPGRIEPAYRNTDATSRRAAAMSIPGRLLSHPASSTAPSRRSASITVSTESAITSRDTSEKCMPSCPIEIPPGTEMVPNSIGNPPPPCTPCLLASASRARDRLQGVISFHDEAIPICGFVKSSSSIPSARSMPRAAARSIPSVTSRLRGFTSCSAMEEILPRIRPGRQGTMPCVVQTVSIPQKIADELGVGPGQVQSAVELLDGGATVPFIARYRKEVTGALDDTQLRTLEERLRYLRELEERRTAILESIDSQGKLDDELKASIMAADTKARLEDIYLPYKPKRRTK